MELSPRWRRRLGLAASAGGYALAATILVWGYSTGRFALPPGDALIWDRAGDQLRAGVSPFFWPDPIKAFYFAPPWALVFALTSWLPVKALSVGLIALEVTGLRYLAGSWRRVGWYLWFPLLSWELPSAQINLIVAAGLAAALRHRPEIAVVTAFAKLSPALAIDPRDWKRALRPAILLAIVTLPFATLWVDWFRQLARAYGTDTAPGASIAIPFAPRLVVAFAILALRRPWARALAAIVALPVVYWVSSILLLALVPPDSRHVASSPEPTARVEVDRT